MEAIDTGVLNFSVLHNYAARFGYEVLKINGIRLASETVIMLDLRLNDL